MPKEKFLKMFALIELFTAFVFITLAIIFYLSKDAFGGETTMALIFGSIGACALIAAPVFLIAANKSADKNPPVEY